VPKSGGSSFSHDIQDGFGLVDVGPVVNLNPVAYYVVALEPIEPTYDWLTWNFVSGLQDGTSFTNVHAWAFRTATSQRFPSPRHRSGCRGVD
jgi:hypothetical protein